MFPKVKATLFYPILPWEIVFSSCTFGVFQDHVPSSFDIYSSLKQALEDIFISINQGHFNRANAISIKDVRVCMVGSNQIT